MNTENQVVDNKEVENNEVKEETKAKPKRKRETIVLTTKNYTDEELKHLISMKFSEHNSYLNVLNDGVDKITKKYSKQLDTYIKQLESLLCNNNVPTSDIEMAVLKIPIMMYNLNSSLEKRALDMELSSHLKDMEITENLLNIVGGSEKERIRAAEYQTMTTVFTSLMKTRVYYNLKNKLDCINKINDGLKKVLTARIEEMKQFGKEMK